MTIKMDNFFNSCIKTILTLVRSIEYNSSYPTLHLRPLNSSMLLFVIRLFKNSSLFRYNNLTELTVIDTPNNASRFELFILLTSVEYNNRLAISLPIDGVCINSLTDIYPNSSWSEREVRDMFGIHFTNNADLRRLLTDYGFEGFPLRKDFPLTGYLEVRYDDTQQRILYEPVELAQELRVFNLNSPWEKQKTI